MENETNTTQTEATSQEQTETTPETPEKPADKSKDKSKDKPVEKPSETETKPEKTFTQAELDAIVERRLKRERTSAEEKADKALKRISELETKNVCYKLGIKEDCIEDAVALAEKLVNDKTDISAALSKVLEKYPVFKADKSKPAATGVHTETTKEMDDSALRKAFGLPPKK